VTKQQRTEQKAAEDMRRYLRSVDTWKGYAQEAGVDLSDKRVEAFIVSMTQPATDEERLQHEIWLAANPAYADWYGRCLHGDSRGLEKAKFFPA
jgi:hypothetical protein